MRKIINLHPLKYLANETKAIWGTMTPQHMVEHLTMAVQSSTGKIIFDRFITPEDRIAIAKRFLNSSRPLPKLFVNEVISEVIGEGLIPLINNDLSSAIRELKKEVDYFYEYFTKNPEAKPINATFGPLNYEEWITFHNKHFTHHFTQFGLIEE
jgi:oxepin-CoA hydrolase/3-oxo-5,6-dehydrosuberyl-CoA semialdehyde dehydrogenase